jgi:exosome complex RNA-binding protein Rrp4
VEGMVNELKQIRQIIVNGWCKGIMKDEEGNRCLIGAIYKVAPKDVERGYPIRTKVLAQVEKLTEFKSIVRFNDSVWTKKEDVLKIIDATIEEELKNEHHNAS